MLFGLKPSPHLLSAVVRKHITLYYPELCDIIEKMFNSLHVDNLLTSFGSVDEAFKCYVSVKSCLTETNFNLRKFSSNLKQLEDLVCSKYPEDKVYEISGKQKHFGIYWDKEVDELLYGDLELILM